jgi:hypothetical protein
MPISICLDQLDRASRIAEICEDLSRCLSAMDALGLDIAAIHVDHSLAMIRSQSAREGQINAMPDLSGRFDLRDR